MSKVKVKYHNFKIESTFHGKEEYILEAGNKNHHKIKVTNQKHFVFETFDYWGPRITSQKRLLKAFQKMLFHGLAAALDPDTFCYALRLDEGVKATEVRFEEYQKITKKLKNIFAPVVLNEFQMCGFAMALVTRLKKDGIDCGLQLKT